VDEISWEFGLDFEVVSETLDPLLVYEESCWVRSLDCWVCHIERGLAVGVKCFPSDCSVGVDEVLALYAQFLRISKWMAAPALLG